MTLVPAIDVIVPTYDDLPALRGCLDSLARQTIAPATIFVCVDGSTDGTLEWLGTSSAPVPVTTLDHPDHRNHGRAATRNLALPHLRSPFVLFLDADMRPAPDAVERHRDLLSSRACVSIGDVVYHNADVNLWARYVQTRGKNKAAPGAEIRPLDFVTANTALRADDLRAVGGFDPTLTGYGGEDTELALRLSTELGRPFIFNAAARATTDEPKTVSEGLAELRHYGATNLRVTRQRHPGAPAPFWIDRLESGRLGDRLLRACLNPLTDAVVEAVLPIAPFRLQRTLLNYQVIRAVWAGYASAASR